MTVSSQYRQSPAPGASRVMFCGDMVTFTLTLPEPVSGKAVIRTNIGHGAVSRREIIEEVEQGKPPLAADWFDIPMTAVTDRKFRIVLPLIEPGHFEAKTCFFPKGGGSPIWPEGPNTNVHVQPADTCGANIIYNAFIRQFGPNKSGGLGKKIPQDAIDTLDKMDFTVIPPSGTFRDFIRALDFIIGELGCRVIQLLPVHPVPTTYARMGRFGSPYAALSFTQVDPALAVFDARATPLEQFIEMVDAIHARRAKILIDIAINHTGWAARLHEAHPEWLVRGEDGQIEVPGAWGVRWEDLTKLDYRHKGLWRFMADIFLLWCRRGVDGFRCDAGYMVPVDAWRYIIAKVRHEYPDAIFNLEGLGGPMAVTKQLLGPANMNWAYSELFQNYDRGAIEHYLPSALDLAKNDGLVVHFAETHDNKRLAATSTLHARMRTALCALFSQNGAFGFTNGVEWYADQKIDVHNASSMNWGNQDNQVSCLRRLHDILSRHPTFYDETDLKLLQEGGGNCLVLLRHHHPTNKRLIVAVNLDDTHQTVASWNGNRHKTESGRWVDLLTGEQVQIKQGNTSHLDLAPGQARCLSPDPDDLALVTKGVHPDAPAFSFLPELVQKRCVRAMALKVYQAFRPMEDWADVNFDDAARRMCKDPAAFCRKLNPQKDESGDAEPRARIWQWPRDRRREVMVPTGHPLLVRSPAAFSVRITDRRRCLTAVNSIRGEKTEHFAFLGPFKTSDHAVSRTLRIKVFESGKTTTAKAPLLLLPALAKPRVRRTWRRPFSRTAPDLFLAANGRGAMMRAAVKWGTLNSRYDALLAANLNPDYPEDRWIMFTRCRGWIDFQGYSIELNETCLVDFIRIDVSAFLWRFRIPTGKGRQILLSVGSYMVPEQNAVALLFHRHREAASTNGFSENEPVRLILRPDIEDRNFHETTKAGRGSENQRPESVWPKMITVQKDKITFAPASDRVLKMTFKGGRYQPEPEWQYMVYRPLEAERGLDPHSDLFSPGYFHASLKADDTMQLTAAVSTPDNIRFKPPDALTTALKEQSPKFSSTHQDLDACMKEAMSQFVVRRGSYRSVIAGYPWFLDWGRDSLIAARGIIAAGELDIARAVLLQFGRFEENGTIPNMIRGAEAGNRETSDAPLWFFTACRDLINREGSEDFLNEKCGRRTLRNILISIGENLVAGLSNGVAMDSDSGLIFSPSHFTWMDTNYPAGSPRQGYPVEIQALWFAALSFLSDIDAKRERGKWRMLAGKVRSAFTGLYFQPKLGYLSDCLHADAGMPAKDAQADDALRPNQLLALTLGGLTDKKMKDGVLSACETLIVPGGIRSLADQPVARPIPVHHENRLVNDPQKPYAGVYSGDEDTRRKPAYHNGTAWTWPFPVFCEAWLDHYGPSAAPTVRAWLGSSIKLLETGCLGQVPEILDGDAPHHPRGCDAQAWGVSEWLRVWQLVI